MAVETRCSVCEADFRVGVLKDGKCPSCAVEFPNAKNKKEAMAVHPTPNKMGDELDEAKINEMIDKAFSNVVRIFEESLEHYEKKVETTKRGPGRPKKEETV